MPKPEAMSLAKPAIMAATEMKRAAWRRARCSRDADCCNALSLSVGSWASHFLGCLETGCGECLATCSLAFVASTPLRFVKALRGCRPALCLRARIDVPWTGRPPCRIASALDDAAREKGAPLRFFPNDITPFP